jgi:hypothetical protein
MIRAKRKRRHCFSNSVRVICDKSATGRGNGQARRAGEQRSGDGGVASAGRLRSGDSGESTSATASGAGEPPGTRSEVSMGTCLILPRLGFAGRSLAGEVIAWKVTRECFGSGPRGEPPPIVTP